uniref:Ribosomal protein S9 n=1 Tax=Hildenbrandia rivularis TaxID=135206 RepID=A0A1C9CFQ9_9FLOR|nr:ribosomal protein S9 [Hildenbrandia rivularis]AOM67221.1 ribosomal protein S9 [Hildenbrandia rivularis]
MTNLKHSLIMYYGTGKRKTSVARARLIPGSGNMTINHLPASSYLQFNPTFLAACYASIESLGLRKEYDIYINTQGGGLKGQSDAICLGIARALCNANIVNKKFLKARHYLTRDSRIKERKKYGLRKARKAPQYSKR